MKLALIPPIGYEDTIAQTPLHLVLAHIFNPSLERVVKMCKARGDYTIVDNGTAEGCPQTGEALNLAAKRYMADELILPDVLGDTNATIEGVRTFLKRQGLNLKTTFMGVVQGVTLRDLQACVWAYSSLPSIKVIGIPRAIITANNLSIRLALTTWIHQAFPKRFDVHLLGASPLWPRELAGATRYHNARSVDTSLPYNYTLAGVRLAPRGTSPQVGRPLKYFSKRQDMDLGLLQANIDTVLGWTNAETSSG